MDPTPNLKVSIGICRSLYVTQKHKQQWLSEKLVLLYCSNALKTSPMYGWRVCLPSHALNNAYYRIKKLWSCEKRIAIDPLSMRHSRDQRKNHVPYLYWPTMYQNLNSLAEVQSSCFPWKIATMAVSKEHSCSVRGAVSVQNELCLS